ncbi:MAG: hypothetical protein R3B70_25945 [Polyangiaceae bacterium]
MSSTNPTREESSLPNRLPVASLALFLLVSAPACSADPPTTFDATFEEVTHTQIASGNEWRGTVNLQPDDQNDSLSVSFLARLTAEKGPRRAYAETVNARGQRIAIEDDEEAKTVTITVDDYSPVVIKRRADGLFAYDGSSFANTEEDLQDLGHRVADKLRTQGVQRDSVAANSAVRQALRKHAPEVKGGCLFGCVDVDIFVNSEVDADFNVQMGYNGATF